MEAALLHNPAPSIVITRLDPYFPYELRFHLLGQALTRIREFSEKYDGDADPVVFCREIQEDFIKQRDHEFFIVVAVEDGRVVGHMLARLESYYGRRYVFILQTDISGAGLTPKQIDSGFDMLSNWAQDVSALGIRLAAITETHVRLFKKREFTVKFTAMKRDF